MIILLLVQSGDGVFIVSVQKKRKTSPNPFVQIKNHLITQLLHFLNYILL